MGKYKFDFRKLYSLIICFLCFLLMFFSDNISEYVMLTIKNELIPKAKNLGATDYVDNIMFVLEDWEAWKKYRG